jgi:CDP-diacylglycerol---serine O-phosphatidyltransferase
VPDIIPGGEPLPADSAAPIRKRPPRAAYALPTLFTAGNIFLGFLSIVRSIHGVLHYATSPTLSQADFEIAAKTIGLATATDFLDGGVARLTNTTSEFGRELDSLADIISFGIAPSVLAYAWGVQFVASPIAPVLDQFHRFGTFIAFVFLVCGAARLARFNISKNPIPRNPGKPHRKYFVGLPIPAAAAMVAAVVYGVDSYPLTDLFPAILWLMLLALLSFLMVCTWRYRSFKDINLMHPRSPLILIAMAGIIFAIWNWSQPMLLIIAAVYVGSGIAVRIGGIVRRHFPRPPVSGPPTTNPETQLG